MLVRQKEIRNAAVRRDKFADAETDTLSLMKRVGAQRQAILKETDSEARESTSSARTVAVASSYCISVIYTLLMCCLYTPSSSFFLPSCSLSVYKYSFICIIYSLPPRWTD